MTNYVVLREVDGHYEVVKTLEAYSAAAAISKAAGDGPNGHYVATPAASWKPQAVEVQTKRQVVVTPVNEQVKSRRGA